MTITVMQQRQGMIRTLVVLLFFCLTATTTTAQRTNPCPSDPATSGYTTISDINLDLQDAADLVLSGDTPPILPLLYPICPGSALIFEPDDVPIQPRLDASFTCGIDGEANNCQIQGGTTQFLLRGDTAFPDLGLSNVTMRGIIFSAFTEASIAVFGSAEIDVDVVLEECSWTGFDSLFVINATSANPGGTLDQGQIIIRGAEISQGTANVGIFNNGGLLAATGLNFATVTMLTAIESSNSALTSIEEFRVTASDIPRVTATNTLAILVVNGGAVVGNTNLQEAFFFNGPATSDELRNSLVANMTIAENIIAPTGWTGVFAGMGLSVSVLDCFFTNNVNMRSGVTASETSTVVVGRSDFNNNVGTSANVSALVLAISDAVVDIDQVFFTENMDYTSQVFSIFRSTVGLSNSCIIGGSSETVIFISQDSLFDGVNVTTNFVLDHTSVGCNDAGSNRLFFEDEGSLCFQGGECAGTCRAAASSSTCVLDGTTSAPTPPPIDGSTVSPVTPAPVGATPTTAAPVGATPTTAAPVGGTPTTAAPVVAETPQPTVTALPPTTAAPVIAPTPPPTGIAIPPTPFPVTSPNAVPTPNAIPITQSPIFMPNPSPVIGSKSNPPMMLFPTFPPSDCDSGKSGKKGGGKGKGGGGKGKGGKKECKSQKGKKRSAQLQKDQFNPTGIANDTPPNDITPKYLIFDGSTSIFSQVQGSHKTRMQWSDFAGFRSGDSQD